MPEAAQQQDAPSEQADSASAESKTAKKPPLLRRFFPGKWAMIVLGVSVVNFAIGYACCWWLLKKPSPDRADREIRLGSFQFEADSSEAGPILGAEFSLHIALLDQLDRAARRRLQTHKFRVQQDVEELLRQAHSGDFEDPKLSGLKRQLQEQVNQTLGMRVIADVIITELRLSSGNGHVAPAAETAETLPWVQEQSELAVSGNTAPGN